MNNLLTKVKKALLIPEEETFADDELMDHIQSCMALMSSTGIKDDVIEKHPMAHSLVVIYCKTFFGFKIDGSVKELPDSFNALLKQLSLTGDTYVSK